MVITRYSFQATGDGTTIWNTGLTKKRAKKELSIIKVLNKGIKVDLEKLILKNGKVISEKKVPLKKIVSKTSINKARKNLLKINLRKKVKKTK